MKLRLPLCCFAVAIFVAITPSAAQGQVCRGQADLTSKRPVQIGGAFQRSGPPTPSHAAALDLALGVSHLWATSELVTTKQLDLDFSTVDLNVSSGVSFTLPKALRTASVCPSVSYHVGRSVDPQGFYSNHVPFITEVWSEGLDAGFQIGQIAGMRMVPFTGVSWFQVTVQELLAEGDVQVIQRIGTTATEWHAGVRFVSKAGLTFGISSGKAFASANAGTPVRLDLMYSVPPFWHR